MKRLPTPDESVLRELGARGHRVPQVHLRSVGDDPDSSPSPSPESRTGARYELTDEIARGGMGVVHRAHDVELGRSVAVKVLRAEHADRSEIVQRFVEEAQIGGQLQHPGLVTVYDLGLRDGRPYFVMKLVKGSTLKELLDERSDPTQGRRHVLSVFEHVCETMAYVHARGVIHRDLKPANVMVGAFGEVQIVDWGLAKVLPRGGVADERRAQRKRRDMTVVATVRSSTSESESLAGQVMGTLAYMAPEQARGQVEGLDERADVFALGAILCEILTGRPPYVTEDGHLLAQAADAALDPAMDRLERSDADPVLVELCRHCLATLPSERPRHAGRVVEALRAHEAASDERARRAALDAIEARARAAKLHEDAEQAKARARAQRRTRHQTVAIAIAALLALLVGGGGLLLRKQTARDRLDRTSGAFHETMREARLLEGRENWDEAIQAARRAEDLARAGQVGDGAIDRAGTLLAGLEAERTQHESDRRLVALLEEAQGHWGMNMNEEGTDDFYVKVFGEFGLDEETLAEADTLARLRESPIAREIADGLISWAWLRRGLRVLRDREALVLVRAADAIDPDPARAEVRSAIISLQANQLRQVVAVHDPDDLPPSMLGLLGSSLSRVGEVGHAVALLERAVVRHPRSIWLRLHLGNTLSTAKRAGPLLRCFSGALALSPDNPLLYVHVGDAYIRNRDLPRARSFYERALEIDPGTIRAYVGKGLCQMDTGDADGAVDTFRAAIEARPKASIPHWLMGNALQKKRRFDDAKASYEEAIRLDPDNQFMLRDLGQLLLYYLGDAPAAARALEKAVQIQPTNAGILRELGEALIATGRQEDAIRVLRDAIAIDPKLADAHLSLGRVHWLRGEFREAHTAMVEAAKLGSANATQARIDTCARLAAVEPRVADLRRGSYEPESPAEWRNLGELLYWRKLHATAVRCYARAFEMDPSLVGAECNTTRYTAACSAVLAAAGQTGDSDDLDADARRKLRERGLAWLREELALMTTRYREKALSAELLRSKLTHWKRDGDLPSVRDPAGLDQLPADQAAAWRKLWEQHEAVLAEVR